MKSNFNKLDYNESSLNNPSFDKEKEKVIKNKKKKVIYKNLKNVEEKI